MKYNFAIKNLKIEGIASIEDLNLEVTYAIGEIPEILGHVLPFVERLAGEVLPKLMDKFVETKKRVADIEKESLEARNAEYNAKVKAMEEPAKATSSIALVEDLIQELDKSRQAGDDLRIDACVQAFEDMLTEHLKKVDKKDHLAYSRHVYDWVQGNPLEKAAKETRHDYW